MVGQQGLCGATFHQTASGQARTLVISSLCGFCFNACAATTIAMKRICFVLQLCNDFGFVFGCEAMRLAGLSVRFAPNLRKKGGMLRCIDAQCQAPFIQTEGMRKELTVILNYHYLTSIWPYKKFLETHVRFIGPCCNP